MAKPTLLLIDGNSLAFRAFYALINQVDRFVNHEGLHTNALVGFNNLLDGIIDPFNPDLALVAWDAGKTTFSLLTVYQSSNSDDTLYTQKAPPCCYKVTLLSY